MKHNAIDILKHDHDRIKDLFKEYERQGDEAAERKQFLANQVFGELDAHSNLEEQIFYPAVRAGTDETGQDLVLEGIEEHHVMDQIIDELRLITPAHQTFDAKFKVLRENVEHHIAEEEDEMFPRAKRKLGDRLDALGEQMWQRKEMFMAAAPQAGR